VRMKINLDEDLLAEAMGATGLPTKEAAVEEALRRLVAFSPTKGTHLGLPIA
jgi:Arc/MetJ family transcription regulator